MENKEFRIPKFIVVSKNVRLLHFITDSIIMYLIVIIIVSVFDALFMKDKIPIAYLLDSLEMIERYLFWSVISLIYYGTTEVFLARSFAKYFTKTIVVMADGSKPKPLDIFTRTLLRIVPFEHLTFLEGRKLGLHDEYSKTFVVKEDKLKKSRSDFNELAKIENSI